VGEFCWDDEMDEMDEMDERDRGYATPWCHFRSS
jgi:hypothetical protein